MKKYTKYLLFIIVILFILSGCKTEYNIKDENNNIYSAEKLLLLGQESYKAKDYETSIKYYQAIIDNYPDDDYNVAWAYYEIGFIYYVMEDYVKAKEKFNKVIIDYPKQEDQVNLSKYILEKIEAIEKENEEKNKKDDDKSDETEEN